MNMILKLQIDVLQIPSHQMCFNFLWSLEDNAKQINESDLVEFCELNGVSI